MRHWSKELSYTEMGRTIEKKVQVVEIKRSVLGELSLICCESSKWRCTGPNEDYGGGCSSEEIQARDLLTNRCKITKGSGFPKKSEQDEGLSPGTFHWDVRGQRDENKLTKETEGSNQ